jgi:hypothetical protein
VLRAYADMKPAEALEQLLAFDFLHNAIAISVIVFEVDADHRPVPAHGHDGVPSLIANVDGGARSRQAGIDQQQPQPGFLRRPCAAVHQVEGRTGRPDSPRRSMAFFQ